MRGKDRIIEGKQERQRTMDKLSIKGGRAYTYDKRKGKGSDCLSHKRSSVNKRR